MRRPTPEELREAAWATCAAEGHKPTLELVRTISEQPVWTCDCRTVTWHPKEHL